MRLIAKVVMLSCWVLLSGCGLARMAEIRKQTEEANRVRDTELAECKRLYPGAKENLKPMIPATQCENDANLKYVQAIDRSASNPYQSSFRVLAAKRLVAAERYDNGATTEAQFKLEMATAQADLDSSLRQTENQRAMVAAAQQQADAASMAALTASIPKTTTCTTVGNMTTCN